MEDQIQLRLSKRFERDDDDASRVRPAYVNNIDLARVGAEIFMDMCIMPVDDLAKAKESQAAGSESPVEVIVLDRYVFGLDTFLRLRTSVEAVHAELSKIGSCHTMPRSGSMSTRHARERVPRRQKRKDRGHPSKPSGRSIGSAGKGVMAPTAVQARSTLTIPEGTAVVYTESRLMAFLLQEIEDLKTSVHRIEAHLGIGGSDIIA